jgi:hypothetical protein
MSVCVGTFRKNLRDPQFFSQSSQFMKYGFMGMTVKKSNSLLSLNSDHHILGRPDKCSSVKGTLIVFFGIYEIVHHEFVQQDQV